MGFGLNGMATADVNGDGLLDVVVANAFNNANVGALLGNGDGNIPERTNIR